jgi:hypothetical protein
MSQRALNSITEHPANSEFAPPGAFLHEPIRKIDFMSGSKLTHYEIESE